MKLIDRVKKVEAIPVDFITGFIDTLMLHRVFGNEEEKIASYYGINVLESLLDSYYDEVNKNEQSN